MNELILNSRARNSVVVWLGLHTAEGGYDKMPANVKLGSGSAESLIEYFAESIGTNDPKSSHAIADDDVLLDDLIPYNRAACTMRNGNDKSDNLEMMGLARWDRPTWLEHDGLLWLTARWLARRAMARSWTLDDLRHLSLAQVRAGNVRGVVGHVDYTNATHDGTHWDPGPNFPYDVVLNRARLIFGGVRGTPDTKDDGMSGYNDVDSAHGAHVDRVLSANQEAQTLALRDISRKLDVLITLLTPPTPKV